MSVGVQGIIVSGEASESDEEEEFNVAQVKGQLLAQRSLAAVGEGSVSRQPSRVQHQQQEHLIKRTHVSILHQKLWGGIFQAYSVPVVQHNHLSAYASLCPLAPA